MQKRSGLAAEVRAALKAIVSAENASNAGLTANRAALRGIFVKIPLAQARRMLLENESLRTVPSVYVAFWVGEHDYYQKLQRSGRRGQLEFAC